MGCFSVICALSGTPINYHDKCVAIPIIKKCIGDRFDRFSKTYQVFENNEYRTKSHNFDIPLTQSPTWTDLVKLNLFDKLNRFVLTKYDEVTEAEQTAHDTIRANLNFDEAGALGLICYPTEIYHILTPPIFGEYNDYGTIENYAFSNYAIQEKFETFWGCSTNDFLGILRRPDEFYGYHCNKRIVELGLAELAWASCVMFIHRDVWDLVQDTFYSKVHIDDFSSTYSRLHRTIFHAGNRTDNTNPLTVFQIPYDASAKSLETFAQLDRLYAAFYCASKCYMPTTTGQDMHEEYKITLNNLSNALMQKRIDAYKNYED